MPDPNVTIRHARTAIYMVLNGAVRDIENHFADDQTKEREAATTLLFQQAAATTLLFQQAVATCVTAALSRRV